MEMEGKERFERREVPQGSQGSRERACDARGLRRNLREEAIWLCFLAQSIEDWPNIRNSDVVRARSCRVQHRGGPCRHQLESLQLAGCSCVQFGRFEESVDGP